MGWRTVRDPGLHVACAVGLAAAGIEGPDAVRQLASAGALPADSEARIAAMDLEPTLRDRALLLLEQTRMLVERADEHAADGDRLQRAALRQADGGALVAREATADARDDVLEQRDATADARDDTLVQREATAVDRDDVLDDREEAADQHDQAQVLLDQAMQRWVGHALHELRQPLAVIAGAAETLHERRGQLDEPTRSAIVDTVRRQSMQLQRMLDQMAQARRLHDGLLEVHPQQVELQPLIADLLDDYRPLLGDVTVSHPRTQDGDGVVACVEPSAAVQILLVLLRNAVDHAPCQQPILVETVPGAASVRVSVHDDGPGVAPGDREHIFDYGTRLNHGGSLGLGLFIARRLARAHGGDVTVDSSQQLGGARFDLTLPRECADRV